MCCTILSDVPTESWKLLYQVHWRTSQEVMLSQTLSCCCLGNPKTWQDNSMFPSLKGPTWTYVAASAGKCQAWNLMKTWNQKITSWKSERKIAAILHFCNIKLDSWHMTQDIGCEKIYRNRNCDGTTPWKSLKPPFKSCFPIFEFEVQTAKMNLESNEATRPLSNQEQWQNSILTAAKTVPSWLVLNTLLKAIAATIFSGWKETWPHNKAERTSMDKCWTNVLMPLRDSPEYNTSEWCASLTSLHFHTMYGTPTNSCQRMATFSKVSKTLYQQNLGATWTLHFTERKVKGWSTLCDCNRIG